MKEDDIKILHNIAICHFHKSECTQPTQLLAELKVRFPNSPGEPVRAEHGSCRTRGGELVGLSRGGTRMLAPGRANGTRGGAGRGGV